SFWAKAQEACFPLDPVARRSINSVFPYSEGYLYYALPLQAVESGEVITATLREKAGSRSIILKIPARMLRKANLY
ncbi:MAG: hypothetical protein AAGE93_20675, partial [Bacteroidota bacterium]